jgi:hypothetical protein
MLDVASVHAYETVVRKFDYLRHTLLKGVLQPSALLNAEGVKLFSDSH